MHASTSTSEGADVSANTFYGTDCSISAAVFPSAAVSPTAIFPTTVSTATITATAISSAAAISPTAISSTAISAAVYPNPTEAADLCNTGRDLRDGSVLWVRLLVFRWYQLLLGNSTMTWQKATVAGSLTVAIALVAYGLFFLMTTRFVPPSSEENVISLCIETYRDLAKVQNADVDALNKLNTFCYNSSRSQLLVDEENIRKDNFVFQRHENIILLFMVVMITLSGVALAGLQLLASYKLAVLGRGDLAGGGELSYSKDSVSFKSSVVGLVILFISFAFFIVFVHDVYTLKEGAASTAAQPGISAETQPKALFPVQWPPLGQTPPQAMNKKSQNASESPKPSTDLPLAGTKD